ncbi:hypothetical protein QT238_07590 [Geobacillus stearothermophilus]|nr:hypothetical protein QT238_07590 [Geobacillus stearothermophilus]
MSKCVKIDNDLVSTAIEDSFNRKLEQLNIDQLQKALNTIKNAYKDVEEALRKLLKSVNESFDYNYYEYKNEDNKYESIKEIIENEL